MEAGFELDMDNILDSLNLTGQWQPSSLPDILDPTLTNQILDGIVLSPYDSLPPLDLINNDDISNALVDTQMERFDLDDITKLISTPMGELPQQSTIEETLENMNLEQSQTDILSSSICTQMGSSPVEPKEIINSNVAEQIVRQQKRLHKNASKSRKSIGHQQSSSVGPIDILSSYGVCQPCTASHMPALQFDTMDPKKIQIISQPRHNFRPRTQNESKVASHYLRSEPNSLFEYPTIGIPQLWAYQSMKNIIEITLVAKDKQAHAYGIENKTSKPSFEDDALIFRQNEPHTLYFCVTSDDIQNGIKSFMIEYVKCKQNDQITKDLIRTRQLEQSMLRFTRIYLSDKNTFQRDESSVEYSSIMTEAYGDIGIEHMGPRYGPMVGNERVYAVLKGRISKDDLAIFVTEDTTKWRQQIPFTRNGNVLYFTMPPFPYSQYERAVTNITIYHKGEELHQSTYSYNRSLDEELSALTLNDSTTGNTDPQSPPPPGDFNAFDFFLSSGAVPSVSKKSSTTKTPKRLNHK